MVGVGGVRRAHRVDGGDAVVAGGGGVEPLMGVGGSDDVSVRGGVGDEVGPTGAGAVGGDLDPVAGDVGAAIVGRGIPVEVDLGLPGGGRGQPGGRAGRDGFGGDRHVDRHRVGVGAVDDAVVDLEGEGRIGVAGRTGHGPEDQKAADDVGPGDDLARDHLRAAERQGARRRRVHDPHVRQRGAGVRVGEDELALGEGVPRGLGYRHRVVGGGRRVVGGGGAATSRCAVDAYF